MADLFGKMLALVVGVPVFACTLGGTISLVWLLWLGEWKLALLGFFVAWVAKHAIAYLNLLPISISILGMKLMKKTFILGSPVFFFSTFLSFAISYIWICLVVNIILPNAHKIIMPYILFAFSMSMSPFLKMNDPSSEATTIHILSTLIGTFVLYLTILISGFSDMSFYKGANYMSYVLLIGAVFQTGIAIYFEKNRRIEENEESTCWRRMLHVSLLKKIWAVILGVLVLCVIYYSPYHAVIPDYGEKFIGYGTIFTAPLTGIKRVDNITTIDYGRIILELIAVSVLCSTGYIFSTLLLKKK